MPDVRLQLLQIARKQFPAAIKPKAFSLNRQLLVNCRCFVGQESAEPFGKAAPAVFLVRQLSLRKLIDCVQHDLMQSIL
jgi:hypothetical protein